MENSYIVCGIGTGCGKSVTSVLLYEFLQRQLALEPILIKPVQTGATVDTDFYQACEIKPQNIFNFYTLQPETSIHTASRLAKQPIIIEQMVQETFLLLRDKRPGIIELAGGLLSPINESATMLDFVKALQLPVIVVFDNYLGAINHALLTIEVLHVQKIKIIGLINNTTNAETVYNEDSLKIIHRRTGVPQMGCVPYIKKLSEDLKSSIRKQALVKEWQLNESNED